MDQRSPENLRSLERDHPSIAFLCSSHLTADCFEPDSAIAATMGITKQQRLKPDAVPALFERQAPQHLGASRVYRRWFARIEEEISRYYSPRNDVDQQYSAGKKAKASLCERERSRVRNTSYKFMYIHAAIINECWLRSYLSR